MLREAAAAAAFRDDNVIQRMFKITLLGNLRFIAKGFTILSCKAFPSLTNTNDINKNTNKRQENNKSVGYKLQVLQYTNEAANRISRYKHTKVKVSFKLKLGAPQVRDGNWCNLVKCF